MIHDVSVKQQNLHLYQQVQILYIVHCVYLSENYNIICCSLYDLTLGYNLKFGVNVVHIIQM